MKNYKFILVIVVKITIAVLLTTRVYAALDTSVENQSVLLMDTGDAQAAYELLRVQKKSTPQDWFLFGMAARKAGYLDEAEHAFREVLHLDPGSRRAKLELATVLGNKGDWSESRRLLLDVKAASPPARVVQNIDRYLALIDEREANSTGWRMRGRLGYLYDSNVNNGPTVDTVTLFGLPFLLSEDAKSQSDLAYTMRLEIDHFAKLNWKTGWQSNVTLNWIDYFNLDQFDTLTVSASTGPVVNVNDKTILSVPVIANIVSYRDLGDVYSNTFGIAPQLRFQMNQKIAFNLITQLDWRRNIHDLTRNTVAYSVAPGVDIQTCGQGTVRFGGSIGRDKSGIDIYSNDNWGLNASLFCPLGPNMAVSTYVNYSDAAYDAREIFYTEARHDKRTTLGANLQYAYQPLNLDGVLGVTWTDNDSNLDLYTYEKIQFTASVRKKF